MTRRGKSILASIAVLLVSGGLAAAVLSSRTIEGSIPGDAAVLSLASLEEGLLVGTGSGLYLSPDGKRWALSERFSLGPVVVKSVDDGALVARDESLYAARGLSSFDDLPGFRPNEASGQPGENIVAVASGDQGMIAVTRSGRVFLRLAGEPVRQLRATLPRGVHSVAVGAGKFFAGGLAMGVWVSEDQGASWQQVLATPVAAVEIETGEDQRVFLGTPGGLLVSDASRTWRFAELRTGIDALTHRGDEFFAVSDRLVYTSRGGDTGWRAISAAN